MKKIVAFALIALFSFAVVFAQEAAADAAPQVDAFTVRTIIPENQHTTDRTANVRIEYEPMYDEARVYYTCMYVTYNKDEAMTAVRDCLNDFLKDNQYYHYTYMRPDRERYFRNDRGYSMTEYMSYVKLSR